jgi:MtN3 and saliva related transmembrane protein
MNDTAIGVVAATWGVIMALSPVMQIRRMIHLRSSRDISIGYLVVIVIGFSIWVTYGIAIENAALIVSNTVALLVGATTVGIAIHYRKVGEEVPR